MIIEGRTIKAEAGKTLKRKADGLLYGSICTLGLTFCIGGVILDKPKFEYPEDFEEVDISEYYEKYGYPEKENKTE